MKYLILLKPQSPLESYILRRKTNTIPSPDIYGFIKYFSIFIIKYNWNTS